MTKLTSVAKVFQQQIQLPLAADDHAPSEPEKIVFRQEIGVDAGHGNERAGIALAVAAVYCHPAVAVLQPDSGTACAARLSCSEEGGVSLPAGAGSVSFGSDIQYRLNATVNTHSP